LERLDVALPRAGAISGRIHDEFGDPVAGVVARALRVRYVDGRPRLTPMSEGLEALLSSGFTDDTGRYRIHGLPPGGYVIQAAIGQTKIPPGEADDRTSYAPTYYPGTGSSADAQRLTLGVGEDLPNIDLQLLPVRHVTLSGTAVSSSGQPPARASVELLAPLPDAFVTEPKVTVGADGTFTITNVPPGEYRVLISVPATSGREFGIVPVTVGDRDVTGIAVVTASAATLSGRAVSESGKPLPETLRFAAVSTTAAPSVPITTPVLIEPNGTFEMRGLVDKHLFVLSEPSRGWFLKSVTIDGKDFSDSGYEFKPGERVSRCLP
jgi:hypothetical protein